MRGSGRVPLTSLDGRLPFLADRKGLRGLDAEGHDFHPSILLSIQGPSLHFSERVSKNTV